MCARCARQHGPPICRERLTRNTAAAALAGAVAETGRRVCCGFSETGGREPSRDGRWLMLTTSNPPAPASGREIHTGLIVREQCGGSESNSSSHRCHLSHHTTTVKKRWWRVSRDISRRRGIDRLTALTQFSVHVAHARPVSSAKVCHGIPDILLLCLPSTRRGVSRSHRTSSNPGDLLRCVARPSGSDLEDHHGDGPC